VKRKKEQDISEKMKKRRSGGTGKSKYAKLAL